MCNSQITSLREKFEELEGRKEEREEWGEEEN
jgi:hypothetical protein